MKGSAKKNNKNQRIIVVLGMHRSGTSAITKGLEALGVSLGDQLMAPAEGNNSKGFFEDTEINALNIEILKAIDSDWSNLAPIGLAELERLREQGYILRAVELLIEKIKEVNIFAFKDPRVSKLLCFWNEVLLNLPIDVSYLIALRHPLSVVKSLIKRDGFAPEHSYLLWVRHVLDSLIGTSNKPRLVIDFDRLIQSPELELTRIASVFNLKLNSIEFDAYKNQFLDVDLRHTVFEANDLMFDLACPPIVREIFARLSSVASDQIALEDAEMQIEIKKWSIEFERMKVSLRLADQQYSEISRLTQLLQKRDWQLNKAIQVVQKQNAEVVFLNQKVKELNRQID